MYVCMYECMYLYMYVCMYLCIVIAKNMARSHYSLLCPEETTFKKSDNRQSGNFLITINLSLGKCNKF